MAFILITFTPVNVQADRRCVQPTFITVVGLQVTIQGRLKRNIVTFIFCLEERWLSMIVSELVWTVCTGSVNDPSVVAKLVQVQMHWIDVGASLFWSLELELHSFIILLKVEKSSNNLGFL